MASNKTRRSFSLAFKTGLVNAIKHKQARAVDLLQKYDLSRSTLDRWIRQEKEGTLSGDDSEYASMKTFDASGPAEEAEVVSHLGSRMETPVGTMAVAMLRPNGAEVEQKLRHENEVLLQECNALRRERDLFRDAWLRGE